MIIVYNSKSGFSSLLADRLGEVLRLEVFDINELRDEYLACDMIFITHIHNDKIAKVNYLNKYDIKLLCVLGAHPYDDEYIKLLKEENNVDSFYYGESGISFRDTSYFDRVKLNFLKRKLKKKYKEGKLSNGEIIFLKKIENDDHRINYNMKFIINWYNEYYRNNQVV